MTDVNRLADLIAGRCHVRAGAGEGVLVGFAQGSMLALEVDGQRVEVPWGDVVELEALDPVRVAAHWAAMAELDRVKAAELARGRVRTDLLVLDDAQLAAVVRDPDVAARLRTVPPEPTGGTTTRRQ